MIDDDIWLRMIETACNQYENHVRRNVTGTADGRRNALTDALHCAFQILLVERVQQDLVWRQPPNTMKRINSIYAFLSVDPYEGNESACWASVGPLGTLYPLIAADQARLKSFEPIAEEMAKLLYPGAIRLVEFTGRRDLREIKDED
jgi:hypothetical protein